MTDKELNDLIKQVKKCKDMDQAEELYERILSMPELAIHKSNTAIADLKLNRAINLETIANWYLYESPKSLTIRAHTTLKIAHQEVTEASALYENSNQKIKATALSSKLFAKLEQLEITIESKCASMPDLIQLPSTNNAALETEEEQPSRKKTKFGENPNILLPVSTSTLTLSRRIDPDSYTATSNSICISTNQ